MKQFLEKIKTWFLNNKNYLDTIITFILTLGLGFYNVIIGILVGSVFSLGKEYYKRVKDINSSTLGYDVLGILIAVIILLIV